MTIIVDPAKDAAHMLDTSVRADNPLYADCDLVPINDDRTPYSFGSADHYQIKDIVKENLKEILATMPSGFLIITGLCPNWLRAELQIWAHMSVSVLVGFDGKNAELILGIPPATRAWIHEN